MHVPLRYIHMLPALLALVTVLVVGACKIHDTTSVLEEWDSTSYSDTVFLDSLVNTIHNLDTLHFIDTLAVDSIRDTLFQVIAFHDTIRDSLIIIHTDSGAVRTYNVRFQLGAGDSTTALQDSIPYVTADTTSVVALIGLPVRRDSVLTGYSNPHIYLAGLPDTITWAAVYPGFIQESFFFNDSVPQEWQLDSASWPGVYSWGQGRDTLSLLLGSKEPLVLPYTLGHWEGLLQFDYGTSLNHTVHFDIIRRFSGFAPVSEGVSSYWSVLGDSAAFLGNNSLFTMQLRASKLLARSTFLLVGDFDFEVKVHLPGLRSGYSAALFLSPDSLPLYENLLAGYRDGFAVYADSAIGLSFNGEWPLSKVACFSVDKLVDNGTRVPNDITFRVIRHSQQVSILNRESGAADFNNIYTFIHNTQPTDSKLPGKLYVFLCFGVFDSGSSDIMIEWSNFVINQGELLIP